MKATTDDRSGLISAEDMARWNEFARWAQEWNEKHGGPVCTCGTNPAKCVYHGDRR
jgi:hypothetical protein